MLPKRSLPAVLAAWLAGALALSSCGGAGESNGAQAGAVSSTAASATLAPTACGTHRGRGCAPASERVDLARPSFSNSTRITNPLFPIGRLHSALLLGHVDGKPFRTETTLLPGAQTIVWNGQRVRVLVSQYVAYLDGRLTEVALDRYAQADDGSVWYFGEDVFDYAHGAVFATEGTWLAGREGPAAMIMPAKPAVGDVYRPENAPGVVFEEVTVASTGRTVEGPRGAVDGAIVVDELHADGTHEDKAFAPGYGEFRTAGGGDLEALALAVPADALPGPPPDALTTLATSAEGILEAARVRDWAGAAATLERLSASWKIVRADSPPRMIAARVDDGLASLTRAVRARQSGRVAQAAIDVAQSALDLELRHRPPAAIDAARFHLWTQQLRVDAATKDRSGVAGDVAVLEWIRDRIAHKLGRAARHEVDTRLGALRTATDAGNLTAAADHAARLGARLRGHSDPVAATSPTATP
jgi:hypothetical protein